MSQLFVTNASDRARIRITGSDRAAFLHNMVTAEVKKLSPGEGRSAAIVNQRGGILDWVQVYAGDAAHWVIGGAGKAEADLAWLDRYLISEDAQLEDLGATTDLVYVTGAGAAEKLNADDLAEFAHREQVVEGLQTRVLRTHGLGGAGFYMLLAAGEGALLVERLGGESDAATMEHARVSEGLPLMGRELDEARNPWEARLDQAVALDKGCYLGQEIVARLNAYDKVQRYLVGLSWEGDVIPASGTKLYVDDREVGWVTSAVQGLGLGYLKAAEAASGGTIVLRDDAGQHSVKIDERPFWAGKTRAATFSRQ